MNNWKEEIVIPEKLDTIVADSMKQVKKIHRKHIIKRTSISLACLAIIFAAFFRWGYSNPVLASQIPVIGGIFARSQEHAKYSGDFTGKVWVLEPEETEEAAESSSYIYSATDQGYTFTLKEVYCDGLSLYLGMRVEKEGGLGPIEESYQIGQAMKERALYYTEVTLIK